MLYRRVCPYFECRWRMVGEDERRKAKAASHGLALRCVRTVWMRRGWAISLSWLVKWVRVAFTEHIAGMAMKLGTGAERKSWRKELGSSRASMLGACVPVGHCVLVVGQCANVAALQFAFMLLLFIITCSRAADLPSSRHTVLPSSTVALLHSFFPGAIHFLVMFLSQPPVNGPSAACAGRLGAIPMMH